MRSLDASRNALSSMQGVGRLVRLEQLLLEQNQIEEIAELTQLASLAVLGLGHNLVRGQSLHLPPSLRELHLGHNQVRGRGRGRVRGRGRGRVRGRVRVRVRGREP